MAGTPSSSRFTQSDADALYLAQALADAKGDLLAATAADTWARRAVGADGSYLRALASQASGTEWATGIAALNELFDSTLGADAASIDTGAGGFSTSFDHLLVLILARTAQAAVFSSVTITVNNDGGANYDSQSLRARNVTVDATVTAAGTGIGPNAPGDSVAATVFGAIVLLIPAYAQTTAQKTVLELGGWAEDTATEEGLHARVHRWRSTAAVSRLIMSGGGGSNLRAGTRMTVYGIG